jgi:hypothetical protein
MNPEYNTENDGKPGLEVPIDYGTVGDWDLTSRNEVEYMQKLLPRLREVGLIPVRIGRHKCRVISNDCETDPEKENYGPQEYNLLVVVCKKESADEETTPVEEPSEPGEDDL